MAAVRNILFIMCDQLRWDHLGCYGHPTLRTRTIDALAARGVRFDAAYVAAGVCGPSRMSYYTGRTMSSHGATWNNVPLSIGEVTLGEYLKHRGMTLALTGKTHFPRDDAMLERVGLDGGSELAALLRTGHFKEIDRYDGHHEPHGESGYPDYLRAHGYVSDRPWSDYVISVTEPDGAVRSGWQMRHAGNPSRAKEADSETAYMTDQAIRFLDRQGDTPFVLHLSYVKPHWPYIAPAPYHALYGWEDCLPLRRSARERQDPHPVLAAYHAHEESVNFSREEVCRVIRPVYQGLIQQIDDQLGRLWAAMDRLGRWDDTLVLFCSDHGDFLGDHWLGEKEQFFDTVQRVPFILYNPSPAADATRGTSSDAFVSAIDVVPTFLDALGETLPMHRLEGRSLLPLLRGPAPADWRDAVVSELDYAFRAARLSLDRRPDRCRAWMVRTRDWKFVYWQDFRPQLFDLRADPDEFDDLGASPAHEPVRREMRDRLLAWHSGLKRRVTMTDDTVAARTAGHKRAGVFFGEW